MRLLRQQIKYVCYVFYIYIRTDLTVWRQLIG